MTSRDQYEPGAASGAEVRKDGEKWTQGKKAPSQLIDARIKESATGGAGPCPGFAH